MRIQRKINFQKGFQIKTIQFNLNLKAKQFFNRYRFFVWIRTRKRRNFQSRKKIINIFNKKIKFYLENLDLKKKKERTFVILIGKIRYGKSSIFHIFKRGHFVNTNLKELLIYLNGDSKTQTPNIYSLSEEIDILDTPGFEDNKTPMNDLIPQIQLLEILKSYKNILLLIVFSI